MSIFEIGCMIRKCIRMHIHLESVQRYKYKDGSNLECQTVDTELPTLHLE